MQGRNVGRRRGGGAGGDASYPIDELFSEPKVAIGAGGDAVNVGAGSDAGAEHGDDASPGNPPDLVD